MLNLENNYHKQFLQCFIYFAVRIFFCDDQLQMRVFIVLKNFERDHNFSGYCFYKRMTFACFQIIYVYITI